MRGRNDVQSETRLAWIEKEYLELKEKYAGETAVTASLMEENHNLKKKCSGFEKKCRGFERDYKP